MSKFTPAPGYALILPETTTPKQTGLIINTDKPPYYTQGTVIAIGDAVKTKDGEVLLPPAPIDAKVLYSTADYDKIYENGQFVSVVQFSSIVGVYHD